MNHRNRLLAGLSLLLLAGTTQAQERFDGWLCCNMRTDGKWISDINYHETGKKVLPAGTPVSISGYGRHRVRVDIDGSKQAIGNDYSRDVGLGEFAARYVLRENPAERIAGWPQRVQEAVRAGKVTPGMSREQVRTSLGWPVSSENPDLDADIWRYWLDSFSEFHIHFNGSGQVSDITASPTLKNRVWLP